MNKKNLVLILSGLVIIALIFGFTFSNKLGDFLNKDNEDEIVDDSDKATNVDKDESNQSEEQKKVKAPDFTLKTLDGKEVSLSDYEGKIVWINFWATWCPYCVKEMPDLQKIYEENSDDIVILAVDVAESESTVKDYLKDKNYTFPILLDGNHEVADTYYISSYPTTYFIDKDGYIVGGVPGMMTYPQMKQIFDELKDK